MRARMILWMCAAVLAVAVSAVMPETVLHVQDGSLAGTVRSQAVETVDLSLLADMSVEDTMRLMQTCASSVAVEQGRQMSAEKAGTAAVAALNKITAPFGTEYPAQVAATVPWLYVGQAGESIILWQVETSGYCANPVMAYAKDYWDHIPVSATVWIDENSGKCVGLDMRWDYGEITAEPAPTPEAMASDWIMEVEMADMPPEQPAEEPEEFDSYMAEEMNYQLYITVTEQLGIESVWSAGEGSFSIFTDDGYTVYVPCFVNEMRLGFNSGWV